MVYKWYRYIYFTVKTLAKPCTYTNLYLEWYKSGIFTGLSTKTYQLFLKFLKKSPNLSKFHPYMGKFGPLSAVFSCFYRIFIRNSYLSRAIEPLRIKLELKTPSILNHSTLEIKNPSQKGLRIFKTWWIDVFSNADSEKPHMTVGKNASLMSYRRKTAF